jgi:hypothetical protein
LPDETHLKTLKWAVELAAATVAVLAFLLRVFGVW